MEPTHNPLEDTLERIRGLVRESGDTQAAFAKRLGIDASNLSKSLSGRNPLSDTLINRVVAQIGVSKHWLLTGEGDIYLPRADERPKGAPIYDIDFTAGPWENTPTFGSERAIGHLSMPEVSAGSLVVRVSGDSMMPVIRDGAYIALREVSPTPQIFWGQIYAIVLDDYRMVKTIRRHPDDANRCILHSQNPEYDDIDLPLADIRRLYLVETILNVHRRY